MIRKLFDYRLIVGNFLCSYGLSGYAEFLATKRGRKFQRFIIIISVSMIVSS